MKKVDLSKNNENQKFFVPRFFLLLFFLLLTISEVSAQQEIPQLLEDLKKSKRDTNSVWIYRDLAFYYLDENLDSALYYSELGLELSRELDFSNGKIWTLYQKALAEEFLDRFDASVSSLEEAYGISANTQDSLSMAKLLNALGVAYYYQSRLKEAIGYYQDAFNLSEKINYNEGISQSLNNLGVIHRQRRNFKKALEVYNRSLAIKIAESDTIGIINSRYNLGLLHSYTFDFEKSLYEFSEAEKLIQHIKKEHNLAEVKIGQGVAFYNLEKYGEAKQFLYEGLKNLKHSSVFEKISALTFLGMIELRMESPETGMQKLLEAYDMVKDSDRLELQRQINREMAIAYEILNEPLQSVVYWKSYNSINDSINNEQRHWAIEEMQARFEAIEKDKIIQMQDLQLEREKSQKSQYTTYFSLVVLISVGALIYLFKVKKKPIQGPILVNQEITSSGVNLDFEKINRKLLSPLTNREREIVKLVEEGLTNSEIAARLFVSENTVKTHLKNIFSKTNAMNRTDLIHKLRSY
jgi:DNA-binding CsgD family transcriptional regulator